MLTDLRRFCVRPARSIRDTMGIMDASALGIVLVVDREGKLLGTITDGDVRRAVLALVDLDQPVSVLLARKAGSPYAHPITAHVSADEAVYLSKLKDHNILQLPILDKEDRVVGLVTLDEFVPSPALPLRAVIMAGGSGTRLHPLTEHLPKPMLPVGGRPLMEIMLERLRDAGIRHVKVATHHKGEKITEYFTDGKEFGVELSYISEEQPLGTVGALGLLECLSETTLVMNGDILTELDFRAMLSYHKEHEADLTVAVRHYDVQVPYGVVECEGSTVHRLNEKPSFGFFVNAGIYLLEPSVHRFIPNGTRLDMTELIQRLLDEGRPIVSFPIREEWLDIGHHADYRQAQRDIRRVKHRPARVS